MSNIESESSIEVQEKITFRDTFEELSTATKLSVVSLVGGLCVEGAGLVMTSVNHLSDDKHQVFSSNELNDTKTLAVILVLGGFSLFAARMNHKSKHRKEN